MGGVNIVAWIKFVLWRAWKEILLGRQKSLLLILSIAIGLGAIASTQFYASSLEQYYIQNVKALTGGDLVIEQGTAASDEEKAFLEKGMEEGRFTYTLVVEVMDFATHAGDVGRNAMVMILDVDPKMYPLYGSLGVDGEEDGRELLKAGKVLLSSSTMALLEAEQDEDMYLHDGRYTIGGVLADDAALDAGENPLMGVVLRAREELPDPQEEGNLFRYLLKLSEGESLDQVLMEVQDIFEAEIGEQTMPGGTIIQTYEDRLEEIARTSQQIRTFLLTMGLASLILGGLGVFSAVNIIIRERLRDVAVMKCFGAQRRQVLGILGMHILLLTLLGLALGLLAGVLLSQLIPTILSDLVPVTPQVHVDGATLLQVSLFGLLTAFLFSLLPILEALRIKPLVLYRQEQARGAADGRSRLQPFFLPLLALIFGALVSVIMDSWALGMGFSLIFLFIIAILYIPIRFFIALICRIPMPFLPLKLGLRNIQRQGPRATASVLAMGLGVGVIVLVALLQFHVVGILKESLQDPKSYDVLLMGISRADMPAIQEHLDQNPAVDGYTTIQSVVGSLTAIDGIPLSEYDIASQAKAYSQQILITGVDVEDEQFITEMDQGRWLDPHSPEKEIVVYSSLAQDLHLNPGDELTFRIGHQELDFKVVGFMENLQNLEIQGGGFVVNSQDLAELQATGMHMDLMMVRSSEGVRSGEVVGMLRQEFPQVMFILDLDQVLQIFYRIIQAATRFMQFLGIFAVLAGGAILAGMVVLSKYQRRRDIALIRCFGGQGMVIFGSSFFEYGILGFLAGLFGSLSASFLVYILIRFVFQGTFVLSMPILVLSTFLTAGFAALLGTGAIMDSVREKPLNVLRYE